PFELTGTIDVALKYRGQGRTAVSSASALPYILIIENGGVYWLVDLETSKAQIIIDNEAEGLGNGASSAQWADDHIVLFFRSRRAVKRVAPLHENRLEIIPAEIQFSSLSVSTW